MILTPFLLCLVLLIQLCRSSNITTTMFSVLF
jgi:hypothetical protein